MQAVFTGIAILAGVVLRIIIRSVSMKREIALLEQRTRESLEALNTTQQQLARAQSESASRAGFESLAVDAPAAVGVERTFVRGEIRAQ